MLDNEFQKRLIAFQETKKKAEAFDELSATVLSFLSGKVDRASLTDVLRRVA